MNEVNPYGKYPLCKPIVGDPSSTCERCGGYAGYDLPCSAVPPESRWGPDSGEWLVATVRDRDGQAVRLSSEDRRIDGASYNSPCLSAAQLGETWTVYWTKGTGFFGRIEFAARLTTGEGEKE